MNELEMTTSKICSAREMIDIAAEAIQNHDYNRAETMATAVYEFLGYYLEEFDKKFKDAWQETVLKSKQEESDAYDAVIKEKEYYEPSQVESSKTKSWTLPVEFDRPTGEYFVQFPDELLDATGWEEGDELLWVDNKDGSFVLKKNEQNSN